jgi:uncharacterized protein (DUF433 family)
VVEEIGEINVFRWRTAKTNFKSFGSDESDESLYGIVFAYAGKEGQPMTAVFATQIELDGRGVAWIGGTKTKVTEVVLDKIAYGSSPEEIHFQHPHLSLAQIHAALTYYYENQSHLDAQIQRGLEESEELAAELSDPEFRRKLIDLKRRS